MPLTRADLAAIRAIVRQELEQVLDGAWRVRGVESEVRAEESESKDARHEAIQRQVRADLAQMRRQARERAARPIPDGPFVDAYDADRLLQATGLTLDTWRRRGRLTRNMVKGKLQFSRAEIDAILAEHA